MAARSQVQEFSSPSKSATSLATILLVHGGASSSRMYADLIPLLTARGYHLLTPDLPGHGTRSPSSSHPQLFTFASSVSMLQTLIQDHKTSYPSSSLTIAGISLGGQVVLAFLAAHPELVDRAIVSGVSIRPPDESAAWEVPHLPVEDERWMKILTEDVELMGMENAQGIQEQSFGFTFEVVPDGKTTFPPTLVVVGENDIPMARRDFEELVGRVKRLNEGSAGKVLEGAWHNHSIDVPNLFAEMVDEWAKGISE